MNWLDFLTLPSTQFSFLAIFFFASAVLSHLTDGKRLRYIAELEQRVEEIEGREWTIRETEDAVFAFRRNNFFPHLDLSWREIPEGEFEIYPLFRHQRLCRDGSGGSPGTASSDAITRDLASVLPHESPNSDASPPKKAQALPAEAHLQELDPDA